MNKILPILLFVIFASFVLVPKSSATQSYSMGVASWKPQQNVKYYSLYYKEKSEKKYTHAVHNIPVNMYKYTIHYLKRNINYKYKVTGSDWSGKEVWWSKEMNIADYQFE